MTLPESEVVKYGVCFFLEGGGGWPRKKGQEKPASATPQKHESDGGLESNEHHNEDRLTEQIY